ncbi:helix-turn-helix domain-containing protein [Siphonobacter sp. SORGH_AS_1065]|uniref:XRE family transcriptional regulator n=1 Tax=Siphonobacter sp. SORGH_AS_1065 TaxID=3041795 RepID=UPI0027898C9B|nr:helix-turn-helix domain-containing protein [Siphonobacter sp. SORGH_AS_1065]MDQ1088612.1 transcriptional regulator with XRE-family HTH domain [Siphonobacter sp. SORGH_AS_1065]
MQPDNQSIKSDKAAKLKDIRTKKGLSQKEMAQRLGFTQQNIAGMESRKRPIGPSVEYKILKELNINKQWWETGEGEMYNEFDEAEPINTIEDSENPNIFTTNNGIEFKELGDGRLQMTMPLVDQSASAGYMESWADPTYIDELPKHTIIREKRHRGFYRAFRVKGDSMDNGLKDAICNGDIVAGRKIEKQYWTSKLHIDTYEVFVIVHQTQGIAIKSILDHDVKNGKITCRSKNPDRQAYPDFTLDLNDVMEIYNVVSIERKL